MAINVYNNPEILGVILAGGNSRRMGDRDKFLLPLFGFRVIDHVINRLSPQVSNIILNANLNNLDVPIEVVPDLISGEGPLGGLYTALMLAKERGYSKVVTVPADTPYLPDDFVTRLCVHSDNLVVVAKSKGQIHPVLGLWDIAILDDVDNAIKSDELKMIRWLEKYSPIQVEWMDMQDPFFNINTPEDYAVAQSRPL